MNKILMGVVSSSRKIDEKRMPIHPQHLLRIPEDYRKMLIFEEGYGKKWGISDGDIKEIVGGIAPRYKLLKEIGNIIIPKPVVADLEELKIGGTLWGWTHCIQQESLTQIAINRKQTIIAFEDMFSWSPTGRMGTHTFYKNNELAGYCAILHALQLKGIDGHYGNQRKVIIFGFGSVSRGAIYALKARGFKDITICTHRQDHEVRQEVLDCQYVHIRRGKIGEPRFIVVEHDGRKKAHIDLISKSDIIVNGSFQDTNNPINYVMADEVKSMKPDCLIVDVSCDEGMGFCFAKPTTFKDPIMKVGTIDYYAVDHTPSYLWESATRSISSALITHLPAVIDGQQSWQENNTIKQAINIDKGVIKKTNILTFQNRHQNYPHNYN